MGPQRHSGKLSDLAGFEKIHCTDLCVWCGALHTRLFFNGDPIEIIRFLHPFQLFFGCLFPETLHFLKTNVDLEPAREPVVVSVTFSRDFSNPAKSEKFLT